MFMCKRRELYLFSYDGWYTKSAVLPSRRKSKSIRQNISWQPLCNRNETGSSCITLSLNLNQAPPTSGASLCLDGRLQSLPVTKLTLVAFWPRSIQQLGLTLGPKMFWVPFEIVLDLAQHWLATEENFTFFVLKTECSKYERKSPTAGDRDLSRRRGKMTSRSFHYPQKSTCPIDPEEQTQLSSARVLTRAASGMKNLTDIQLKLLTISHALLLLLSLQELTSACIYCHIAKGQAWGVGQLYALHEFLHIRKVRFSLKIAIIWWTQPNHHHWGSWTKNLRGRKHHAKCNWTLKLHLTVVQLTRFLQLPSACLAI